MLADYYDVWCVLVWPSIHLVGRASSFSAVSVTLQEISQPEKVDIDDALPLTAAQRHAIANLST